MRPYEIINHLELARGHGQAIPFHRKLRNFHTSLQRCYERKLIMRRHLPPYAGLRAFEAAARLLSFRDAAEELNVTQSAISHQLKSLETYLGVSLFSRLARGLRLTEEGQQYLVPVREALDQLSAATARVRGGSETTTLTIGVLATFANRWLIPRLSHFQTIHPEIGINLVVNLGGPVDFARSNVDVALRWGLGNWDRLTCVPLMPEEVFPVCSPTLPKGPLVLKGVSDLKYHRLLHNNSVPGEWEQWLASANAKWLKNDQDIYLQTSDLVLQAAAASVGVGLGRRPVVDEALDNGTLIVPFGPRVITGIRYFLIYPPEYSELPKVGAFREWLLSKCKPLEGNRTNAL